MPPRVLLIKIWFCWCFQDCHPLCYEAENCHSGGWVQLTPASMEVEGIGAGDLLFLFLCSGHRQARSESPVKQVPMLLLKVKCHREVLKMAQEKDCVLKFRHLMTPVRIRKVQHPHFQTPTAVNRPDPECLDGHSCFMSFFAFMSFFKFHCCLEKQMCKGVRKGLYE